MEQRSNTYTHGLVSVVVYRPSALDEKERQKREKNLERALARYGREMVQVERRSNT